MPSVPSPLGFLAGQGDLPVKNTDDVLATYALEAQARDAAPVRDALIEAETEMFMAWQRAGEYAAAQSSSLTATGIYLTGQAADRGVHRQENEQDEALRDRVFTAPVVVTPDAIIEAVKGILAPYTTVEPQLFDSVLDRLYLSNGDSDWACFLTHGEANIEPKYPERHYELRPNSHPGGAWCFGDVHGRHFVLRVPDVSGAASNGAFVYHGQTAPDFAAYLSNGDGIPAATTYLFAPRQTAAAIYKSIIETVERLRGAGVRWTLLIDPKLN